MKILEVAGSGTIGSEEMGPVSSSIFKLSEHFSRMGHDVTIVDSANRLSRAIPNNVTLEEVDARPRAKKVDKSNYLLTKASIYANEWRFVRQIRRHTAGGQYDVTHIHEPVPAFLYTIVNSASDSVVYTAHTPNWLNPETISLGQRISKIEKRSEEMAAIKRCDLTIALGSYLPDEFPNEPIAVVPNGIEADEIDSVSKSTSREQLGIDKASFVAIFVGRVSYIKGVDILLDAIDDICDAAPDLECFVIGSQSGGFNERESVSDYAKEIVGQEGDSRITFTGFIPRERLELFLNATDVLVLPSRFEAQGKVVLEAMSLRKPVIGSNIGGIREMIQHGENGYLFEPGDADSLAELLLKSYQNQGALEELGTNAKSTVENGYTWEKMANQHIDQFQRYVR